MIDKIDKPVGERNVDDLIKELEGMGLGWSLDHTANLIEARVWYWPSVIGRYRPSKVEPIAEMLRAAMKDAGIDSAMDPGNPLGD